jgi:hypothetical protein
MKDKLKYTLRRPLPCLVCLLLLLTAGGCDRSDDVISIFTGKQWKLSFIAIEGSTRQYDFWNGNEYARTASFKLLESPNNFVLSFQGANLNGTYTGGINGKGVLATLVEKSTWSVQEGKRDIVILPNIEGTETDVLAKAFINALSNCFRYEGDNDNLYLYYHSGQNVMFMAFKPQSKQPS